MFKKWRKRRNNNSKLLGMKQAWEDTFKTNSDRYVDRLIQENIHDLNNPVHRERVAYEDPLARMFTWDFQMRAWDDYPKFYASDQQDALEILPEIRAFLMDLEFHKLAVVQAVLKQAHGWQTSIVELGVDKTTMQPKLDYTIFSERQCAPQEIKRKGKNIIGWNMLQIPQLPLNRTPMNADMGQIYIPRNKPNIIFDTRGEEQASWGFGYSRFEHTWDAITKLRMESDADAFRKAIFPIAIYPPDWSPDAIDKFFDKMSNLSRTTAAAYPAAKDQEGKLYDNIPSLTFMSPSDDVKQTGSGQFGGLSYEWTRLLAGFKHTMGYVVGGGAISASQSAAGVDLDDDQLTDIAEWNITNKSFIKKFLQYLVLKGVIPELPPGYTVKCAWQWKYDEMMMQQAMMMENQLLSDERSAATEEKNKMKENAILIQSEDQFSDRINALKDTLSKLITSKMGALQQSSKIPDSPSNSTFVTGGSKLEPQIYKGDAQGLGWQPVNSQSGNVKAAAWVDPETIIVDYKGGTYEYSDKDGSITGRGVSMKQVFDRILTEGGEAVWEYLRAPLAVRAKDIAGRESDPQGYSEGKYHAPKGPKGPYTGESHYATYKKTTKSAVPTKMGMPNQKKQNMATIRRHPILQRVNSISAAVKQGFTWEGQEYHSKSKAYEILNQILTEKRINSMHWGNSFSTKNPFKYPDPRAPQGYVIEYQCPEGIKKLVNTSWPIWIDHLGERDESDYVGQYHITGFDEEQGIEIANYDIDWDKVDQWFETNHQSNFTLDAQGQRIIPDTSTEYITNIKYDKDRHLFIQTEFDMAGVALVPRGNCSGPYCGLK
jgi:hypothetical protein